MMSAHDVAVAALTEAATIARIESQPAEPTTLTGATADGIAKGMSNPEPPSQAGNSQKTLELPAISSNDSQTTTADVNTPPTSDGFSQSQESKKQDQISQHPAVQSSNNSSQSDGLYSPRLEATNAGQKRTHDGLTKSSSPERPSTAYDGKYSRDTSSTSIILSRASPREVFDFPLPSNIHVVWFHYLPFLFSFLDFGLLLVARGHVLIYVLAYIRTTYETVLCYGQS